MITEILLGYKEKSVILGCRLQDKTPTRERDSREGISVICDEAQKCAFVCAVVQPVDGSMLCVCVQVPLSSTRPWHMAGSRCQ